MRWFNNLMRPLIIAATLILPGCSSTGFLTQAVGLACPALEIAAELTAVAISVPEIAIALPQDQLPLADMAVGLITIPCYREPQS